MSDDRASIPTVSRVFDDGTIVELVFDPVALTTAFAVARPDGSVTVEASLDAPNGERLLPYSAKNNLIASGCVLLASDIGDFGDKGDLVRAVQSFLHRYVDLTPLFEEIAAHYLLLSWVYDAFNDLPYLRLQGDYGTGKTRGLLALGALAYKPFFASGASTVSPIFHIQDAFQGTLILDEADFRLSDQTAELTKVLNNGTTRGMPVLRTMTNRHRELNPTAFRVFGPKIIAMRESFADRALESRFLTERTGGSVLRDDIPVHLPESFKSEALALRNKLLAWRLRSRHTVCADPARLPPDISPRAKQTSLAILSLVDDAAMRARIAGHLSAVDESTIDERAEGLDAAMLTAVVDTFQTATSAHAAVGDVTRLFNERNSQDLGQPMSAKWVGSFVRRRLRLATAKTGGVYVIPPTERARVMALAKRFGVTVAT